MTSGSLLDTHLLVWLDTASFIRPDALLAMGDVRSEESLRKIGLFHRNSSDSQSVAGYARCKNH